MSLERSNDDGNVRPANESEEEESSASKPDENRRGVLRAVGASAVTSVGLGSAAANPGGEESPTGEAPDVGTEEQAQLLENHANTIETLDQHGLLDLATEGTPAGSDVLAAADEVDVEQFTDVEGDRRWFLTLRNTIDGGEVTIGFAIDDEGHGFFKSPDHVDDEAIMEDLDEDDVGSTGHGCDIECLNDGCCCHMCGCEDCPTSYWCNYCECANVLGYECNGQSWALRVCDCCQSHIWCSLYCPDGSYGNC